MLAFVMFSLVQFLSTSREIGWEKHLQNNLFSVESDVNCNLISQYYYVKIM